MNAETPSLRRQNGGAGVGSRHEVALVNGRGNVEDGVAGH